MAPRTLTTSVNDPRLGSGRPRNIWLMEGGYCSDTKFEEKLAEQTAQHERLVGILRTYGYDVWLGPMPLGVLAQSTLANCRSCKNLG